jgi:DNA-binding NarL/FixJ family response regulator
VADLVCAEGAERRRRGEDRGAREEGGELSRLSSPAPRLSSPRVTPTETAKAPACRAFEGLGSVDVALLDLMLPDGDGTELIVVLRGADPGVKVLVLSASIEPGLAERVAEAGADGVLNKATALTEIVAEVARLAR